MRGFTLLELAVALGLMSAIIGLAIPTYRKQACFASATEAKYVLNRVKQMESSYKTEFDAYAQVKTSCTGVTGGCLVFTRKGRQLFTVSATTATVAGKPTFTATALGVTGSSMDGAVWRTDQTGVITDVTQTCKALP
jgi:prepilin-type N-terminal cleavage/methylation domain-containing protein